jgi:hypothetical protein
MQYMGISGGVTLGAQLLGVRTAFAGEPRLGLADAPGRDAADGASVDTRWERSARHKQELTKDVIWLTHEPLDFLLRRGGDHFDDEPAHYDRMLESENIKRMADAGVLFGRIFFYKGFGLEYERPHMEQAQRAAELMHRLGMKVSLYIGGTMFTETLYRELPEAQGWEQRDQWDHWVPYGIQTYRHYACPNEPKYREYLKRVIKIGIHDLGADELTFDNIMLQAEPKSCRCPRCIKAFADFLRKRYPTKEAAKRRFGLPDVDWIRVNQWDSDEQPGQLAVLDDPVLQEWVRFRCESLAMYSRDLYDFVKSENSNVAVLFNIKGVFSFNRYWTNAVYQPLYAGHIDLMAFDTNGYEEHIDANTGALISQIRSYKMARRLGTSCEDSFGDDVRAAVHMAFGMQKPVCVPAPQGPGAFNVFTPMMEFFREYNDRYFTNTDNVADVAVLRNWSSMAYSISATYVPTALMEQVLIQYKVPFDLIFEEQLERISRYSAVILAGQECISEAQVAVLLDYARNGGTLIVTGNTGQYDEWREQRSTPALLPARREGKGRILYIPEIIRGDVRNAKSQGADVDPEPGATAARGVHIAPPQWVLPKNHEEIYKTVASGVPKGLSIATSAPLTTVMELLTRAKTNETIVHFVNFDRASSIGPFSVTLHKQFAGKVKSVTCMTPDRDASASLTFEESDGSVKFMVPKMSIYSMLVVAQ